MNEYFCCPERKLEKGFFLRFHPSGIGEQKPSWQLGWHRLGPLAPLVPSFWINPIYVACQTLWNNLKVLRLNSIKSNWKKKKQSMKMSLLAHADKMLELGIWSRMYSQGWSKNKQKFAIFILTSLVNTLPSLQHFQVEICYILLIFRNICWKRNVVSFSDVNKQWKRVQLLGIK